MVNVFALVQKYLHLANVFVIASVPIVTAIKKRSYLTRAFCMICLDWVGPFIKSLDGILIV